MRIRAASFVVLAWLVATSSVLASPLEASKPASVTAAPSQSVTPVRVGTSIIGTHPTELHVTGFQRCTTCYDYLFPL
ncbi:hypothetical protein B0H11DRAFT_2098288 [Mycena galericulata]|nr:hypothetical protein B0H11DRAFT_2098288 [Mycena galericulata]